MMDVALAEVKHHPYLGDELSDDLTWATHIGKVRGKANRSLNFISRNLYDCPQKVKETAYKSFVRPNLEYANFVWDLHLKKEITTLEKVQRKAAHFVTTDYSREKNVTNMLNELQWPTLKQCHFVTHQNLLWKAVNNQVAMSIPPHIKPSKSQSRGHNHIFINISARIDNYKYSFFPKTICCWNLLPPTIVQSNTTDQFTNSLSKKVHAGHICVREPKESVNRPPLGSWTPHQQLILVY